MVEPELFTKVICFLCSQEVWSEDHGAAFTGLVKREMARIIMAARISTPVGLSRILADEERIFID